MRNTFLTSCASALAVVLIGNPAVALAQQVNAGAQADEAPVSEGDIVVTAQRREQRLKDVPVSVSVTRGETLVNSNITSITDLAARLPGVRISQGAASGVLNVRGIGSGQNAGFEQAVGTFVDGLYRGRSRAIAGALFDLERVEVLRGPQTTFFGNNVIAGALNIVTRKAGNDLAANVTALYSPTDGAYNLEGGIDIPASENLAFRVAARAFGRNGWADNTRLGITEPHERDWIGRISAVARPMEGWRMDLRVDRGRLRDRGSPVTEGVYCQPVDPIYGAAAGTCQRYLASGQAIDNQLDFRTGSFGTRVFYDFVEAGMTNAIEIGSATLTLTTGYFSHKSDVLTDNAPFPIGGIPTGSLSANPVASYDDFDQFSQEVRLQTDTDRPISFMLGGYYSKENLVARGYGGQFVSGLGSAVTSIVPTVNASTPISSRFTIDQDTRTLSAFGSVTAKITDALRLDLGLRYSNVRKSILREFTYGTVVALPGAETFVELPIAAVNVLIARQTAEGGNYANPVRKDDKFMPSIGLRYEINPQVSAYATFTKGFKAGGFAASNRKFVYDPENVNAYEVGIKGSFFGNKLFSTLAFFRSDYKGLQEASNVLIGTALVGVIGNAAAARAQGVEFSGNLKLSPYLSVNLDAAYLDATYRSYPSASCTVLQATKVSPCTQELAGKSRAFAPKFSGSLSASIGIPAGDGYLVKIDPLVNFTTSYFQTATADPLLSQSGYTKWDLRLSFGPNDRNWEVAVIGRNLSNMATASLRNQIPGSPGSISALTEPPRTFSFQVSAKF